MNIAKEDIMKVFGFVINCLVSKICSFEKLLQDENPIMLCLQETEQSKFIHRKHYRNVGINKDLISVVEVLTGHCSVVNDSEERKQNFWNYLEREAFYFILQMDSNRPTTFLVCDRIWTQLVF